jgi:hypothetical protein
MTLDTRRAPVSFALYDESGSVRQSGEAEAVVGDDALVVGPVTVSWLDADVAAAADYRIQLDLWPRGRLVLSQLGRRFDTFSAELQRIRNQARVAGLLAHGITMPEVFSGALLSREGPTPAELQVYDTHVTVVPVDRDPWQLPLGAITSLRAQADPPAIVLETPSGLTTVGQLARRRDACEVAITERREAQRRLLADVTGQAGFSDGWALGQREIRGFDELIERYAAPERASGARQLLAVATAEPRLGFVQLLDPDGDAVRGASVLPENWAAFLLVPSGTLTVLEILAGPSAATYAFRGDLGAVNRDLQLLHFRRAPLALTGDQAQLTPSNPHRLALRKLEPLKRLRAATVARVFHTDGWANSLWSTLARGDSVPAPA